MITIAITQAKFGLLMKKFDMGASVLRRAGVCRDSRFGDAVAIAGRKFSLLALPDFAGRLVDDHFHGVDLLAGASELRTFDNDPVAIANARADEPVVADALADRENTLRHLAIGI